jgi:hypothetical protein
MPEISRFYGIIIRMYFADHNPPHFHAEYQGFKAEYDIQSLSIIAGELPKRAHALVLEWASLHRMELLNNWKLASKPDALKPIEPLD